MTARTASREWIAALDCPSLSAAPVVPLPSTSVWLQSCLATHPRGFFVCTRSPGHGGRHHSKSLRVARGVTPGRVLAVWS